MKNARLTLLVRAKASVLAAIRHHADTPVEASFRQALDWLNRAIDATRKVQPEMANACMGNAMTHMLEARRLWQTMVT